MYLVLAIKRNVAIETQFLGKPVTIQEIPLIWSDGMIGAVPVFKKKADAQRYAGKDNQIVKIQEVKNDQSK